MTLERKMDRIVERIRDFNSVVVAFSGGVDSTVVARLAQKALGDRVLAVTIDSPLFSEDELANAKTLAKEMEVSHIVLELDELMITGFDMNPRDRCYICKKTRYQALIKYARDNGYEAVLEGTNTSDMSQYRPGLRASDELGVIKPLLEAELTKEETRRVADLLGLTNAYRPSNSCLASRIPYDQKLTRERLRRIEEAEAFICKHVGAKIVRLRDHGDLARVELGVDERKLLCDEVLMDVVDAGLRKLGFRYVTLDLKGYGFGSYDQK